MRHAKRETTTTLGTCVNEGRFTLVIASSSMVNMRHAHQVATRIHTKKIMKDYIKDDTKINLYYLFSITTTMGPLRQVWMIKGNKY